MPLGTLAAATYWIRPESGSDTARTALTSCTLSNPSGSIVRVNKTAHGLVTGAVVDLTSFSASMNGAAMITKVDNDNFDLDNATWDAPGDTSGTVTPRGGSGFTDAWQTVTSGATAARHGPGDNLRFESSRGPSEVATGVTWTAHQGNANVPITSSTNATPIVVTRTSHGFVDGDTIWISGHTTNTNANGVWEVTAATANTYTLLDAQGANSVGNGVGGASGNALKINDRRIILPSAKTANIACFGNQGTAGRVNWTASASVTCALLTTRYTEAYASQSIDIAAGFTTGLVAYFATGTLDLSAYQQLSFALINQSGTAPPAATYSLKLCSDTACVTAVNTINIPVQGPQSTQAWKWYTVDTGGNFGSSIQSIALYCNSDNGAQIFNIDNIIACKATSSADAISLSAIISAYTSGADSNHTHDNWVSINYINGVRVGLSVNQQWSNSTPYSTTQICYGGTSGSYDVYMIEPSPITAIQTTQDAGTEGSPITYSFGWNRTDMTTQTGQTWIDGRNSGYYLAVANPFIVMGDVKTVRCGTSSIGSLSLSALYASLSLTSLTVVAPTSGGFWTNSTTTLAVTGTIAVARVNAFCGIYSSSAGTQNIETASVYGGTTTAVESSWGSRMRINTATFKRCTNAGAFSRSGALLEVGTLTSSNNGAFCEAIYNSQTRIRTGTSTSDTVRHTANTSAGLVAGFASIGSIGGISEMHWSNAKASQSTTQRHTAADYSWKLEALQTNCNATFPARIPLGRIAIANGVTTTVGIWVYRDSTNIKGKIVIEGGQVAGVDADLTTACEPSVTTWTQYTRTVTPTADGVVQVRFEFYDGVGTTNLMYIDDASVDAPTVPAGLAALSTTFVGAPSIQNPSAAGGAGMIVHPGLAGGMRG